MHTNPLYSQSPASLSAQPDGPKGPATHARAMQSPTEQGPATHIGLQAELTNSAPLWPGWRAAWNVLQLAVLSIGSSACDTAPPAQSHAAPTDAPYVLVLGTAQDGGLPQIGCRGEACKLARTDPAHARHIVSLLLVDPRSDRRWLFEATPDIKHQISFAHERAALPLAASGRPALFDGIFLTHAHMGHYSGLVHLGREAYGGNSVPLHGSPRLLEYLQTNGPWSLLFHDEHLTASPMGAGETVQLAADLSVTAIPVPHREEFSDTMAFLIRGPERSLLFLPDIDKWSRWDEFEGGARHVEDLLGEVDVALLDGTFYADGEIPGRPMASIPHPFIAESIDRFGALDPAVRERVQFIHLNHTNPCADPSSAAAKRVREAGMSIANDGDVHSL
ncbi:MAG: pyrroloquinoline quinone biosynthesis protein B [Planctomycetota bacterium]|jgi:pyrroloquinoline quinone biosynthesis protein B